jgi:lipopolysaccharide/colanic/teichoic acid biosynthesis glycosyltransferase
MATRSPVSRSSFAFRISAYDAVCAIVTPFTALLIRGALSLTAPDWTTTILYCGLTTGLTLIALVAFRIRDSVAHLFSVGDALELAKAVAMAELATCLILFSATRLENIPRTTPVIHALLLSAALVIGRSFVRMLRSDAGTGLVDSLPAMPQRVIVIGANKLSSLYIGFLRAYEPGQYEVIGLLDDRPDMIGRSLAGVRVLGPVNHLLPIVEEFKEHGVLTDRVLIGGDPGGLAAETVGQIASVCNALEMQLDYIPRLLGLDAVPHTYRTASVKARPFGAALATYTAPRYHRVKRAFDLVLALALTIALLPVMLLVAGIVLVDVGLPVLFWQERIGRNGQSFQLHKFRTLKPTFDWKGRPLPEEARLSAIGRMLRIVRLDELPQLLNVLVGDMSLIGPRPLLPRDQPLNPAVRLSVRPGITGWAQVHGGTLLTPEEKNVLDEWYVENASPWVDLRILAKTIAILLDGDYHTRNSGAPLSRPPIDLASRRNPLGET